MRQSKVLRLVLTVFAAVMLLGGIASLAQAQLVHFTELMTMVAIAPPEGWKVSQKPKGAIEKTKMVNFSHASVEFQSGDKKIFIEIINGPEWFLPLLLSLPIGMEKKSSTKYIKPIDIQGFKGEEEFNHNLKDGFISLLVANRFLVSIRGTDVDNTEVLKKVAGKLDLKKLSGMCK